jgi:hypothetical protein
MSEVFSFLVLKFDFTVVSGYQVDLPSRLNEFVIFDPVLLHVDPSTSLVKNHSLHCGYYKP